MKRFSGSVFASLAALICLAFTVAGLTSTAKSDVSSFPISAGNYWVYHGKVRWTHENSDQTSEAGVTWKTEIRRVIHHGDYLAAVVNGWPADLNWSDGHPVPTDSLLVRSPEGKFYLIRPPQFAAALQRVDDPKDSLEGLLSGDDLFLDLPLQTGKKFCDAEGMERADGLYCWVVEKPAEVSLDDVKGLLPLRRTAYPVRYVTNPDDSEFQFVPGVGITRYGYHHHGTVADTELRLVEAHIGGEP